MRAKALGIVATLALATSPRARAAPPEPRGAHPRMLLDAELRAQWREMAKLSAGPVVGAIRMCEEARSSAQYDRALYMGGEWAKALQACLVAWAATDSNDDAATAMRFFKALVDDLDVVGDGRGGDAAARRDHGYAIRFLGPYTALAYDWLHDHPLMTPELAARARQRWAAWTDWYRENGYRAKSPGSNYHAGYLIAATMIAVAQAGEAGDAGTALWRYVVDQLWNKDMAAALSQEGILAGGNWPEGWQYGPLSVAEIALGARVMREAGVDVPGIAPWLSSVMRHHVYSLTPADRVFAGGDTQVEAAYLPPNVLTLNAIALGDAAPEDKRWARGELVRLRLVDRDWLLYDALATIGGRPILPPRSAWPTWYVSANTGTLYARTRWDDAAVWFASECHATIDTDHRHPNTGNFVLSRGRDDVIVDPTPYGSRSTLTSNAPTVASAHLPPEYIPSQGYWGETSGYAFVTQRESGVVAARCDYADQYKFQDRPSDAAEALRDFVLLPSRDGQSAALVVIDRARTGAEDRAMHLRFRTAGKLVLADTLASARVGSTKLSIASILRSAPGSTAIGTPAADDCFQPGVAQGRCDAARIPVTDYRVQIPGPAPVGVHLITVSDLAAKPTTAVPLSGTGWAGVRVTGVRDAVVVWRTNGRGSLHYSAPPGTHVVLDPPAAMVDVTARPAGTACAVQVEPGGRLPARPLVVTLDASCQVALDREAPAASAAGTRPARSKPHSLRSGCCGADATPGSAAAMALVVIAILHGRRRRRRS